MLGLIPIDNLRSGSGFHGKPYLNCSLLHGTASVVVIAIERSKRIFKGRVSDLSDIRLLEIAGKY